MKFCLFPFKVSYFLTSGYSVGMQTLLDRCLIESQKSMVIVSIAHVLTFWAAFWPISEIAMIMSMVLMAAIFYLYMSILQCFLVKYCIIFHPGKTDSVVSDDQLIFRSRIAMAFLAVIFALVDLTMVAKNFIYYTYIMEGEFRIDGIWNSYGIFPLTFASVVLICGAGRCNR